MTNTSITLLLLAVAALTVSVVAYAQTPATTPLPMHFDCVSPTSTTLKVGVDLDQNPIEALRVLIRNVTTQSSDATAPVISGVQYSGGSSLLNNNGKILATSNGVPLSISAGDNVGITAAAVYVDGAPQPGASATAPVGDVMPALFYLRWNARVVAPGIHGFRLDVWDAAGNTAEVVWTMTR